MFWRYSYIYSYGFLIPLISIYLIWMRRKTLKQVKSSPNYVMGISILFVAILLLVIGTRGGLFVIETLSVIVAICGTVLLIHGKKILSNLLFPISYLLFMIPIWDSLLEYLQYPFQVFSAFSAAKLLTLIGIPVYRNAIFLELPNITLEVATICSGLNNLIAVIAIALPLAYIYIKSWRRRILLVVSGVVIAALSNGLRVAIIGVLAYNGNPVTHGPGHIFQAMFVSFVGFAVLFIGTWAMAEKKQSANLYIEANKSLTNTQVKAKAPLIAAAILLIGGVFSNYYYPKPVPLISDINLIPNVIGSFTEKQYVKQQNHFKIAGADKEILKSYESSSGTNIHLYIAYFETQHHGKELVNFETMDFHAVSSEKQVLTRSGQFVEINRIVSYGKDPKTTAYFWYFINGLVISDKYESKVFTLVDSLMRRKSNGAFVMIYTDSGVTKKEHMEFEGAEEFISEVINMLPHYLP